MGQKKVPILVRCPIFQMPNACKSGMYILGVGKGVSCLVRCPIFQMPNACKSGMYILGVGKGVSCLERCPYREVQLCMYYISVPIL